MIAGGIGWLLFGGSGRSARRGSSYMGASTYSTGGYRSRYGTGERSDYPSDSRDFSNRVGSMSGHLSDAVDQAVGSAQDMTDRAAQLPDQAGEMMSSGVDRARGAIEANPLGAAVVAAGLGAAVGLLLPSTRGEQRIFGDARERVVEAAGDKVQELGEKAQTVAQTAADAAKDKAKQEGLTQPAQSSSGRQSTSQSRPAGSSRPNPPTTAAPGPSTLPPQTS
jgi:ElaB/YqjD/DUF883 family membrane-anchored ribosome-binding protein